VRSVLAGAQARADRAGVEIAARSGGPLPPLEVDADRIGQVLANLVDNAIRHTPPGGRVVVAADPSDTGVRLTVSDTGEGIAAEHLPHVFERFYRADAARDREHGGSGIGLAIAQALVQAHGGTIAAHSAGAGHGSFFVVELPAGPVGSSATLHQVPPDS
jgi:signal transduction histidine kinase